MRALLVLSVASVASLLAGCAREEAPRQAWSCSDQTVAGGTTLVCQAQALTLDGPTGGSTSDGAGAGSTSDGANLGSPVTAPTGGSGTTADGSGSTSDGTGSGTGSGTLDGPTPATSAPIPAGSFPVGSYICRAGTDFCPPSLAAPGQVLGAKIATGSTLDGPGGASGSGEGAGSDGSGEGSGSGGGSGEGSGSGEASGSGAGATQDGPGGPAGSGGGESYACIGDGASATCTSMTPTCGAGLEPGATGGCVPEGSAGGSGGSGAGGSGAGAGSEGASAGGSTHDGSADGDGKVDANGMLVDFVGATTNEDGSSTWTYRVEEQPGSKDLSNWVLGTSCAVRSATPKGQRVSPDPNHGITGVKWETGDGFSSGEFSVTVAAGASLGTVSYGTKAPGVALGSLPGPVCE